MYKLDQSIFREYDIRGIYGKSLQAEDGFHIGRRYAAMLGSGKKIAVGRDGRLSSPALFEQLLKGLTSSGIDVVDIGIGPTPMLYFSVFHLDLEGGIMITGSHNPKDHNGFKMMLGKKSLFGDKIRELAAITKFEEGVGKV